MLTKIRQNSNNFNLLFIILLVLDRLQKFIKTNFDAKCSQQVFLFTGEGVGSVPEGIALVNPVSVNVHQCI
ncbi:MAG: hypothetical protein H6Q25_282 [Bacteroidetes bacterium]|nr:hypothetical protein [Bacteroidota bacterium]